jgi:polysaccharide pyruvyl transferase WcaK-like protein
MGNIGNDASMEAVLAYLRRTQPQAAVDVLCAKAEIVKEQYGVPAASMAWYTQHTQAPRPAAIFLKIIGKAIDPLRIASWVRGHDVVLVTGTGILDATLPVPPWGPPLVLLTAGLAGRLFGVKIAYVSVGAGPINQRVSRFLFSWATRMAAYRSFRDTESRDAVARWGVTTSTDGVYPDLAFALPTPGADIGNPGVVCVGVMDYHGSNDDRRSAQEIRQAYVSQMKKFVLWLLAEGRSVRLLIGDTNGSDDAVVQEILTEVRTGIQALDEHRLIAPPVVTFSDVLREVSLAECVVAIRYHNVVAALKLGKPTLAISYGAKHDSLMTDTGFPEFCLPVKDLSYDRLIQAFSQVESRAVEIRDTLLARRAATAKLLEEQFAVLSAEILGA